MAKFVDEPVLVLRMSDIRQDPLWKCGESLRLEFLVEVSSLSVGSRIFVGAPISRPGLPLNAIQTRAFEFVGRLTGAGKLRRVGRRLMLRASQLSWFGEGKSTPHVGDGCHVSRATNFAMPFTLWLSLV